MLYIVATPIGNLGDITLRALETLRAVDLVLAEDTRQTLKLLKRYEIATPLKSFHHHTGTTKLEWVIEELKNGKEIAVVTDAGTPAISDPAGRLVEAAHLAGIRVVPLPGASSVTAVLSVAGINADRFAFIGFLPKKKGRQTLFKKLADFDMPIVLFESPMRVNRTLRDIVEYLGNREVVVGRELTKIHEEILRLPAVDALEHFEKTPPKGEFVIVIN